MQINSAQDYLTMKKRRVVASTFYSTPPEQKDKTNSVYLSTVANNATTRQRVPGGATYTSWCVGCETIAGAPGVFSVVNLKDVVNRQALRPIGRLVSQ